MQYYKKILLISLIIFNISNNFTNYFYNLNKTHKYYIESLGLQYPLELQVVRLLI